MTTYLLDVNVVVAAYRADHPHHEAVRAWFDDVLAGTDQVAVPRTVWASYLRLVTSSRVFQVPSTVPEALGFARAVAGHPQHLQAEPGARHLDLLEQTCRGADATGNLVPDAVLAAIALEHACTIATLDRDFARFTAVPHVRPGA